MNLKIISCFLFAWILFGYFTGVQGYPVLFMFFSAVFIFSSIAAVIYFMCGKRIFLSLICLMVLFTGGVFGSSFLLSKGSDSEGLDQKIKNEADRASLAALESLPYAAWVPAGPDIQKRGVVFNNKDKSFKGLNIYCSRNLSKAYLMDMTGKIRHTWSSKTYGNDSWHHVEMLKNGDLLVVVKNKMLMRLDWDSGVEWVKKDTFHHDITVDEDKDIYTLTRKYEIVFCFGFPFLIMNDYIVMMTSKGKIKKELSVYKILKDNNGPCFFYLLKRYYLEFCLLAKEIKRGVPIRKILSDNKMRFDVFHTNTLEIIDRDIEGICGKGDLLVSFRELDRIAVLNIEQEKIVWHWGPGNLSRQHHPTLLDNNNILVFDNGVDKKRSRIIELDPRTNEIVWKYVSSPPQKFYSHTRGSSQKLPNGNVLISESDKGHVFEITRNGEVVWDFYNPEINEKRGKRAAVYRMMRIVDPDRFPVLKDLEQ